MYSGVIVSYNACLVYKNVLLKEETTSKIPVKYSQPNIIIEVFLLTVLTTLILC